MYIAGLWHPALRELSSGLRERESAGEGREHVRRGGGRGGSVRGRDEAERREIQPQAGGKSILSAQSRGAEKRKKKRHRAERGSQFREKKISAASSPPAWVAGGESLDGVISSTMGCSLCTLQKPEEQYKLLYEVRQVL